LCRSSESPESLKETSAVGLWGHIALPQHDSRRSTDLGYRGLLRAASGRILKSLITNPRRPVPRRFDLAGAIFAVTL
jgi:hypothetical protein